MNISQISAIKLEKELEKKLAEILSSVEWMTGWKSVGNPKWIGNPFDLLISIPLNDGGRAALCVECRRELRPALFHSLAERKPHPAGKFLLTIPVLAIPSISPRMAELCRGKKWSWYDLAGNCRLEVPGKFLLERIGLPSDYKSHRPEANLGTPESAKIVRALLSPLDNVLWDENWTTTQRWIQEHFEKIPEKVPAQPAIKKPSLGLVNKVIRYLRDQSFIEENDEGRLRLKDPLGLLNAWKEASRNERLNREALFTLLKSSQIRSAQSALNRETKGRAIYSAFSAAEIQAPYVRQPKTWLYVDIGFEKLSQELLEAKHVDSGENLIIQFMDDDGVFYMQDLSNNGAACTNPIQTYLDLSSSGGRGQEAADAILNQVLKPTWRSRKWI